MTDDRPGVSGTDETVLARAVTAHGGWKRWNELKRITIDLITGGQLWDLKGIGQDYTPRHVNASLHYERLVLAPYGQPSWHMVFTPDRVAIEDEDGSVVLERPNPRSSFDGHDIGTPWDPLHRAYWIGYTLWTYLMTPFLLCTSGFEVSEIPPWHEGSEVWPGVRAKFPPEIASHCTMQHFYFGPDLLLRRHDYTVDVAGGFAAAHYVSDYIEADGLILPSKRRAYMRDNSNKPMHDKLMIAIDFSNARFHGREDFSG